MNRLLEEGSKVADKTLQMVMDKLGKGGRDNTLAEQLKGNRWLTL